MDSRQVTLLTKGYLAGWFDFKYPNRLSRFREAYIMSQIERDMTLQLLEVKAAAQIQYISVNPKDGGKAAKKVIDDYTRILLPYAAKQGKMGRVAEPQTKEEWEALIAKLKRK